MKKLVALLLLVCMVLSSTAALAELSAPGEYPISDEQYKLKIFTGQLAIFEDFETSYENKYVEELTNVDVEWQPFNSSEVNEKFNFSIADEKNRCDIYLYGLSTDNAILFAEDGVIIPLEDLIDEHTVYIKALLEAHPEAREQITAPDGHIYALPQMLYIAQERINKMWVYKEWLEAYKTATGKDTPATTEEFKDMLIYFRDNDMNGNGDPNDEIPLTGNYQYWFDGADPLFYLMNAFTLCPSKDSEAFMWADEEGNISCVSITDEFREGLKYIHDLYAEKLLAEETYVNDLFQFRQLTSVPKSAVTVGAAAAPYPFRLLTQNPDPEFVTFTDYEAILPLVGPEGVQGCFSGAPESLSMRTFITSSCEHPEVAIKWLDYFYSEEGRSWSNNYGKEGVHWIWADEPSFGGGDKSVKLIYQYGTTQNIYWPQGWGPNTLRTRQDYNNKAAADVPYDNQLQACIAHDKYEPYAVYTNFPQIVWCDDIDLIDERADLKTTLQPQMVQAITEFITGVRDINDDAAWEAYKTEMNDAGLEHLIELHEAYYFGK
jgi:putative aldouronate transport system substrate-binding protein